MDYKSPDFIEITIKCQGTEIKVATKDFFEAEVDGRPILESRLVCPVCGKVHMIAVDTW